MLEATWGAAGMTTIYAISLSPPNSPEPYVVRGWNPRFKRPPELAIDAFVPTLDVARRQVPQDDYQRRDPTKRDKLATPLLIEVWTKKKTRKE